MADGKESKRKTRSKKKLEEKTKSINKLIEQKASSSSPNNPQITRSNIASQSRTGHAPAPFSQTSEIFEALPAKKKPTVKLPSKHQDSRQVHTEVKQHPVPHPVHNEVKQSLRENRRAILPPKKAKAAQFHDSGLPHRQVKPAAPIVSRDSRYEEPTFFMFDRRHCNGSLTRVPKDNPHILLPKEPDIQRNPPFTPKGPFRFLDLPFELRLLIYELLIPAETYSIHWVNCTQKTHLLTHLLPHRPPRSQPRMSTDTLARRLALRKGSLHHPNRAQLMKDQRSLRSPVALLWVNRTVYFETAAVFYGKSTFAFALLSTLRHFINTLHPASKAALKSMHIAHTAYGHPARTDHRVWKSKADASWEALCWRLAAECPALQRLVLDLDYQHSKLQFVPFFAARREIFGTDWMMALWAFHGLDGLREFRCRIRSATTAEEVLEGQSRKIREVVLGEAWDEGVEEGRDGFGVEVGSRGRGGSEDVVEGKGGGESGGEVAERWR